MILLYRGWPGTEFAVPFDPTAPPLNPAGKLLQRFLKKSPSGKIPILQLDGMLLTESTPICEFLDDLYPQPKLMPDSPEDRYEVRRLVNWFDDKFHNEVTSKLLYERINKKIMKQGAPDSKNVMNGKRKIKYHLDYMTYLLERRRWLAGNSMTLADFTAAAHFSTLDYTKDVDWVESNTVKDWYAKIKSRPAFRGILADQISGFPPSDHYNDLDF